LRGTSSGHVTGASLLKEVNPGHLEY
jgi:hypothetical protein